MDKYSRKTILHNMGELIGILAKIDNPYVIIGFTIESNEQECIRYEKEHYLDCYGGDIEKLSTFEKTSILDQRLQCDKSHGYKIRFTKLVKVTDVSYEYVKDIMDNPPVGGLFGGFFEVDFMSF